MTMLELLQAQPVLQKIAGQEIPLSVAYKLSKLFKRLEQELQFFYARRDNLISEYTEKVDGKIVPIDGKADIYNKKSGELLTMVLDLGNLEPLEIPASLDIKLSCNEIQLISQFIVIVEE